MIEGCKREQPRYQRELVERYAPMLLTVARRYACDRHAAQDVLQEALIKIFRALPRYKATGSFEAWLRRIVITTALHALDKRWVRHEKGDLEQVAAPAVSPAVYSHLGTEELLSLIAKLPDGFRQVFNLSVMEQYPHDEIGRLLGISASSSRSQLHRARQLLQRMIHQKEKIRL